MPTKDDQYRNASKSALQDYDPENSPRIYIFPVESWAWICPNCQETNEIESNPKSLSRVTCENCDEQFLTAQAVDPS